MPVDKNLSDRDLKDFWLADEDNLEKATERLSDEERSLGTSEQYAATVEKVTEEEINFPMPN